MKLSRLRVQNFRSCRDLTLSLNQIHAIVGANNAGKSTILRALDFLFNPSVKQLTADAFWARDTSKRIRVEGWFTELKQHERELLGGYLLNDGTLHIAREAVLDTDTQDGGSDDDDSAFSISVHCRVTAPKEQWLREAEITGANIKTWWEKRESLVVGSASFADYFGDATSTKPPTVAQWKDAAAKFVTEALKADDFTDTWLDNPKGYANVLKGILPLFVLVPAVRDISEEAKATKSSPFGRLIGMVLKGVTPDVRAEYDGALKPIARFLTRNGGEERLESVKAVEQQLNTALRQVFASCDVEIDFPTPSFDELFNKPRIFVDDGFRGPVENKGHGLQRAAIFAILRCYAHIAKTQGQGQARHLVLAIEEPELYMHPQAQRTLRRLFLELVESGDQVLFTTHSSHLVDVAYFDEIVRVESRAHNEGSLQAVTTVARQLSVRSLIDDEIARHPNLMDKLSVESMRDYYSHAYNPTRNEGFFAKRVLLVEGDTEQYALPIYADALGRPLDMEGVSVVQCGGKGQMDRLYRIFNELGIPCYMLFDYDRYNQDKNIIAKSKELIALAKLGEIDSNQPHIGPTLAFFPENWEASVNSEIGDLEACREQARRVLGPSVSKPLEARFIARTLKNSKPPIVPPMVKAILEGALKVSWTGSCLDTASGVN